MIVSVTRLRLRSHRYLPSFVLHTLASRRQLLKATGFRDGRVIADRHLAFWTLTRWDSEAAMRARRSRPRHASPQALVR